jgi:hypothetical protein
LPSWSSCGPARALRSAFDRLLEQNLREHLEQSIVVTGSIRAAGHEPAVKALAASIEAARAAQLKLLK